MSDAIRAAFDAAIKAGKGADEVKVEMIKAGCQFKDTGKFYKEWAIESGIMVDAKERAIKVDEILSDVDGVDTEDGFSDAMDALMDGIAGTSDRQAGGLIRAWAKKNEVEVYKKPKSTGGGQRSGFVHEFHDMLRENPQMTEEEATAIINGTDGHKETSENVKRYAKMYQNTRALVNDVANGVKPKAAE